MERISHEDAIATIDALLNASAEDSSDQTALERLGSLIDLSQDLGRIDALEAAVARGNALLERDLPTDVRALVHYFMSNAYEVLHTRCS